ncbi:MAG: trimethylamine methyltransferase family protein [Anaerolineales bacterium]
MQVQCQILTETEKQVIHEKSLRILNEIGVMFHSQKARNILKKHGAVVDDANGIVTIPEELVRQALVSAPKSFKLGARLPEKDFQLPSPRSGYVLDNGGIYMRDLRTGQRRSTNFQDNIDLLRVYDEMQFAALVWPTTVHELDHRSATVKTAIASYMYSSLHIQDELEQPEQVPLIIEALEAILGSAEAVKERKIYSVVYCTLPPLGHEGSMCDAYLELLDYEVPICLYPMPSAGSTGPASLFSNIAMANAEALSALTLFQLAKPGTPIIMGDAPGSTDFRTGSFLEGSPEMVLQSGARGEMAKFYDLPNEQAGCLTDAKEHGAQAIMEKMLTTLPLVLSGVDLIQGPGALNTSNMMSLEQIVVDDEIALVCQRLRDGVDISAEKDYFEDIKDVGPGGHFLGRRNTRKAEWSNEFVTPALVDRNPFSQWVELGRPDLYDNAKLKVEEILSNPQKNPLPDDVIGKLEAIIRKADRK